MAVVPRDADKQYHAEAYQQEHEDSQSDITDFLNDELPLRLSDLEDDRNHPLDLDSSLPESVSDGEVPQMADLSKSLYEANTRTFSTFDVT